MQHIKNLKKYTPDELFLGDNVVYLQCDNGHDWYIAQKSFSADTVKLAYDHNGVICAMDNNVSMLWPIGLSVVELEVVEISPACQANGEWVYNGKKVIPRVYSTEEMNARAMAEQSARIAVAANVIAPLQDAVDLDMATDAEKARLVEWKKYRVRVSRLDFAAVSDIEWPTAPDA